MLSVLLVQEIRQFKHRIYTVNSDLMCQCASMRNKAYLPVVNILRSAIPSNDHERFWGDADNDECPSFRRSGRFTVNNVT